jgi:phage host-nuclease inhibitor protein Gam
MKTSRIKVTLPIITTRDEAEASMTALALLVTAQRIETARRDAEVLAINKKYESRLADLDGTIKIETDKLRVWAESNPNQFPKGRKSLQLVSGTIGFRTGTPKLALLSRAWTWDKVLHTISCIKDLAAAFIRTKQEVDKETILGTWGKVEDHDQLRSIGLRITQDESFFIEPALAEMDARQTTEAA